MPIRSVLFDYGMVLSCPAVESAHQILIKTVGIKEQEFERHYWTWRHNYDAGMFDGYGYWANVAKDANVELRREDIELLIKEDVRMWSSLNDEMVEWANRVKDSGFITGIISNICFELADSLEQNLAWLKRFDHNFWSCRLKVAKPNPAIFEHVIKTIQIDPD